MNPTCSSNCEVQLPPVLYSNCAPVNAFSEFRRIFIAPMSAAPLTDWANAAEWNARISMTSADADAIRPMTVIGDMPAGAPITIQTSDRRTANVGKDRTINATVDDVSDINYEFLRRLECGGKYRVWGETHGGYMYGGNTGAQNVSVQGDAILNRGESEIETHQYVFTWRDKFSPERVKSPIFDQDTSGGTVPTVFDTVQTFASAATVTSQGVTTTLAATDPDAKFEFNAITPHAGAAQSMSIVVGASEQATVDFPNNYLGSAFKYTDIAGVSHTSVFTNGTVTF